MYLEDAQRLIGPVLPTYQQMDWYYVRSYESNVCNEAMTLKEVHRLYKDRTQKKFGLEHWYEMLKDQRKWKAICDPPKSGSGSSKSLIPTVKSQGMKV